MSTPLYLPSTMEMTLCDAATIARGVSGKELMERAGKGIAKWVSSNLKFRKAAILCGPGNNGGDGLVIERILGKSTFSIVARKEAYESSEIEAIKNKLSGVDLVIDALLGTGQKNAPRGGIRDLLFAIPKNVPVICVDVPTGMNADTGEVYEGCPTAKATLTIEFIKRGMLQSPAFEKCGDIVVIPIGIIAEGEIEFEKLSEIKLKSRARDSHKGTFGTVLLVGGSNELPGAPVLSSIGALAGGAGLVKMVKLEGVQYPPFRPEVLFLSVEEPRKIIGGRSAEKIIDEFPEVDSVVIGPGLGFEDETLRSVEAILEELKKRDMPCVIDADALRLVNKIGKDLGPSILTPHPGEASRILNIQTSEVQRDRYSAARNIWDKTHQTTVLKGASTIIYEGTRGYVNMTGTSWMAQGGAGDVLSGLLGSLLAQGYSTLEAAKIGVYVHGLAGELAHQKSSSTVLASAIGDFIPEALGTLVR